MTRKETGGQITQFGGSEQKTILPSLHPEGWTATNIRWPYLVLLYMGGQPFFHHCTPFARTQGPRECAECKESARRMVVLVDAFWVVMAHFGQFWVVMGHFG